MKMMNKRWEMHKKLFWQNSNELNGTYKMTESLMVTFNGLMLIQGSSYEMYDATQQVTILVNEQGVVNIEENKDDTWQMYRH